MDSLIGGELSKGAKIGIVAAILIILLLLLAAVLIYYFIHKRNLASGPGGSPVGSPGGSPIGSPGGSPVGSPVSSPAIIGCSSQDCPTGYACNTNLDPPICVVGTSQECTSDSGCETGYSCVDNQCILHCDNSADCPQGTFCASNACIPNNQCNLSDCADIDGVNCGWCTNSQGVINQYYPGGYVGTGIPLTGTYATTLSSGGAACSDPITSATDCPASPRSKRNGNGNGNGQGIISGPGKRGPSEPPRRGTGRGTGRGSGGLNRNNFPARTPGTNGFISPFSTPGKKN